MDDLMTRLRCAILDDYQNVALQLADWGPLADRIDVTVFDQPFASAEAAAGALKDFEIICAMPRSTRKPPKPTMSPSAAPPWSATPPPA